MAFNCSSHIFEENSSGLHLFMGLPDIEEIAHDHDYVAPALGVLLAFLFLEAEKGLIKRPLLSMLPEMIDSRSIQFFEHGLNKVLISVEAVEVFGADSKAPE